MIAKKPTEPPPIPSTRLEAFDLEALCPKCWKEEPVIQFCPAHEGVPDEHLHVSCRRCDYGWLQRVAPTPEPPPRLRAITPIDEGYELVEE